MQEKHAEIDICSHQMSKTPSNKIFHNATNSVCSNYHCSVIDIEGLGILIEGASGSGKTSLCLGLIEAFERRGKTALLVSDDQVLLHIEKGQLIAQAPKPIQGKVEIRGFGISDTGFKPSTRIGLIGRIIEDKNIARMPETKTALFETVELPLIELPCRHEALAIRIILAWLDKQQESKS